MNFFEHQDQARRASKRLILLFSLAVVLIVIAVNAAAFTTWAWIIRATQIPPQTWTSLVSDWWLSDYGLLTMGVTLFLILAGSFFQWSNLSSGGQAVAGMMGARLASEYRSNSQITKLINVSDEMAIAAGIPAPILFVMEREQGINAFVAGYKPDDAVMVVTRGLLDGLSRDEMQAVVGHEYSHILNGDMRLNMRLLTLLAGITMIGQFGRFIIDVGTRTGYRRSRRGRDSNNLPLLIFGVVIWAIGGIGVFFGRLIKSAVSRQREFLADASAVQFTRNPDAMAGALFRIQQASQQGVMTNRHAEAMSHLCFSATLSGRNWLGNLATHPPLQRRIERISPNFLIKQKYARPEPGSKKNHPGQPGTQTAGIVPVAMIAGALTHSHLTQARELYRAIPVYVRQHLSQSSGAKYFCLSQVGNHSDELFHKTLEENGVDLNQLVDLSDWLTQMPARLKLPCLELVIPTLRNIDTGSLKKFLRQIDGLAQQDKLVDQHEWFLSNYLRLHLTTEPNRRSPDIHRLQSLDKEIRLLLSSLVHLNQIPENAGAIYTEVIQRFSISDSSIIPAAEIPKADLSIALFQLRRLSFLLRPVLLQACADLILSDQQLQDNEYEFLRLVADALEIPLPPLADSIDQRLNA